ncbi:MAG TPA: lactonase family protein [Opitutaceae bacterium]|nr:lactonase family protein [Opitutaceae bacterium]
MKARGILAGLAALLAALPAAAKSDLVYVGTYTDWEDMVPAHHTPPGGRSEGIYAFRLDPASGAMTPLGLAARTDNPTFVAFAPSGKVLYAANELYHYQGQSGAVSAFRIDPGTGRLAFLNQVSARGTGTCYVRVDHTGRNLLAANFGSGSVAVFPLAADGSLRQASAFVQDSGSGPNPRQAGPHEHSFNVSPDDRFAIAAEFGTDRLMVYRFDPGRGTLSPADPPSLALPPASAPRHLAFHPDGRVAYALNEIASTLTVLAYDPARGRFRAIQSLSSLPPGFSGRNTAAEVVVHPSGRVLYASNRGDNSIAVFAIDGEGRLAPRAFVPCGGRTPRGFGIDPEGGWLVSANQDTHNIALFRIDPQTLIPAPTGQSFPVRSPECAQFLEVP